LLLGTEFAAVVRQHRPHLHAKRRVEGQHAIVEQVTRRHRHLRGVPLEQRDLFFAQDQRCLLRQALQTE
jgi:hypothetical protein